MVLDLVGLDLHPPPVAGLVHELVLHLQVLAGIVLALHVGCLVALARGVIHTPLVRELVLHPAQVH